MSLQVFQHGTAAAQTKEQAPMSELTYQDVLDILRLIDAAPFSDFAIELAGTKVKVRRNDASPGRQTAAREAAVPAPRARERAAPAHRAPPATRQLTSKLHAALPEGVEVKPPMAGTFYAAPAPGAAPFVETGRAVRKGDQVGIIEVMKLFTPGPASCDGIVRAILVANEEFVESDQTLMIIQPAG